MTSDGIRSRECEICSYRESEIVPVLEAFGLIYAMIAGGAILVIVVIIASVSLTRKFAYARSRRR